MLDALRKGAGGWLAQLFIALLVVSFAVWGVSDIFTGFRSDTVASVGGTDVSIRSFQRQYDFATRQLSQQIGQPVSADQARLFGVPGQVLGRLVTDATLSDEADRLRLGISSTALAEEIAGDPTFRGGNGAFDRNVFAQVLRSYGYSEDQYLDELRRNYVRQQIGDALIGGITVPDAYLRALHEFRNEERNVSYFVLTPALVTDVGEPSDGDLSAYFEANKSLWKAPEYRAVKIVRMAPEDLASTGDVSDEDARKLYDDSVATRFSTPERRKVEQIIFKDEADADQAVAALAAGKTFDDLVTERGLKAEDVNLGLIARDKILDPKVADAAFGLSANSVSALIDGRFGPVMVRVATIEPASVKPFDEAKAEIKKELAETRAAAEIADQLDVIEDARAGGDTLDDVAAKYGLKVVTIAAVDKAGKDDKGNPIADLPGGTDLVAAAFETDVGIENDPIRSSTSSYVWYDVTAVTAARDRELSEVRDEVVADWKKDQLDKKLTATADDARTRLADGEDVAKIAAELGVEVKTADAVKRNTQPDESLSAAAIQAAFGGPKGTAAVATGVPDQSKIVLVVTDATVPPYVSGMPDMVQSQQQLSGQIANDLLQQYIAQLQDRLGVRVNQTVLQQLIGTPNG
ncbi:MAG: SurA N-terminal domain-containing protein [Bauldia sp.]|nr:SurA N-terminal domain-containing protein [Bauldia sp.]